MLEYYLFSGKTPTAIKAGDVITFITKDKSFFVEREGKRLFFNASGTKDVLFIKDVVLNMPIQFFLDIVCFSVGLQYEETQKTDLQVSFTLKKVLQHFRQANWR